LQIDVSHVDGSGSFSSSDDLYVDFARAGDAGTSFQSSDITNRSQVTPTTSDQLVGADASNSNSLIRFTIQKILDLVTVANTPLKALAGKDTVGTSDINNDAVTAAKADVATQSEAETGTDSTTLMTPERTSQAIDAQNPFGNALLHVQDQKASGTDGGTSSSGQNIRDLNTVLTNEISGASLDSANARITLPAGTYYIEASAPSFRGARHILRPYNPTDSSYINNIEGTTEYNNDNSGGQSRSFSIGRFSLGAEKDIELHHYVEVSQTRGLGIAAGSDVTLDHETYTDVRIWKVG